jgi:hypothetical protein
MSRQTLMLIEVSGIQEYIFASNELKQNIGASELVRQASTDWAFDALPKPNNLLCRPTNYLDLCEWEVTDQSLEAEGLQAEVIYAGGGNALLLFAEEPQALAFARQLTLRALQEAPGLRVVLKHRTFDPQSTVVRALLHDLRGELLRRKLDHQVSVPLLGLGVTAGCVFTGAPAVAEDAEGRLISAEAQAKQQARDRAENRLRHLLRGAVAVEFEFVHDFGKLGERGKSSYLALIHTDGNGMGKRIEGLARHCTTPGHNVEYRRALRRFSQGVERAANEALVNTVELLVGAVNHKDWTIAGKVPVPLCDGNRRCLPFRPIVFGGDDVTFVSEGSLGLALAVKYLQEYSLHTLDDGGLAHARAGVAVVPSHYPFSRAYDVAEELCASAKRFIGANDEPNGLTALDWHFAVSGPLLPLEDIRKREYTVRIERQKHSLLMRPLRLHPVSGDWHSWETFRQLMAKFQSRAREDGEWGRRRNKVKALREALRAGPEAVEAFVRTALDGRTLPPIANLQEMPTRGWQGRQCGYFDAIEALDLYVSLEGGQTP